MEERKKYEFLVFITIYFIFMAMMLPLGVKMPRIFIAMLEGRYGEAVSTIDRGGETPPPPPPPPYARVGLVLGGAAVLSLAAYAGRQAYRKLAARDYRALRAGRAECTGKLAQRALCRHYRATPSTECVHFLGSGDAGMCVRKTAQRGSRARPGKRGWS
jgi:hypothetical protein